jgi:hypothetical protein
LKLHSKDVFVATSQRDTLSLCGGKIPEPIRADNGVEPSNPAIRKFTLWGEIQQRSKKGDWHSSRLC